MPDKEQPINKLIIIDCDGVLYDETELNVDAQIYGFNKTIDEYIAQSNKQIGDIPRYTKEKPINGLYNYINDISKKFGISPETFVKKAVENIDYSHIHADKDNILKKIKELQQKYKLCICSNNHIIHVNRVLKAKFGLLANQIPIKIFDMRYAEQDGIFYQKETDVFISKLEKHFNIKANNFLWIDNSKHVLDTIKSFGCETRLVNDKNRLVNILKTL